MEVVAGERLLALQSLAKEHAQKSLQVETLTVEPGRLAMATATWGQRYDNDQLFAKLEQLCADHNQPFDTADARTKINNGGFPVRFHDGDPIRFPDPLVTVDAEIYVGSEILKRGLEDGEMDINEVGVLVIANSATPDPDYARNVAITAGFDENNLPEILLVETACCGAPHGLDWALNEIKKVPIQVRRKAVVLSVEGCSKGVAMGQTVTGEVDVLSAAVFGNGAAMLAFDWDVIDVIYSHEAKSYPDFGATLYAPNLDPHMAGCSMKDGLTWKPSRENPDRLFMVLPEPDGNGDSMRISMAGSSTARMFIDVATEYGFEALQGYYNWLREEGEMPSEILPIISHQPSKGVHALAGRKLARELKDAGLPGISDPWVMDQIEFSNSISATILANMMYQFKTNGANLYNRDVGIFGYGAGASAKFMVLRFNVGNVA